MSDKKFNRILNRIHREAGTTELARRSGLNGGCAPLDLEKIGWVSKNNLGAVLIDLGLQEGEQSLDCDVELYILDQNWPGRDDIYDAFALLLEANRDAVIRHFKSQSKTTLELTMICRGGK